MRAKAAVADEELDGKRTCDAEPLSPVHDAGSLVGKELFGIPDVTRVLHRGSDRNLVDKVRIADDVAGMRA
jgi:hypothetical protein